MELRVARDSIVDWQRRGVDQGDRTGAHWYARRMLRWLSFVVVLGLLAGASACSSTASAPTVPPAQTLPETTLSISQGGHTREISVQVASNEAERETGLMWVQSMPADTGMLFVFSGDSTVGFWMANTYIPLDIAYISADGEILGIVHGKPLDQTVLEPPGPYRYALEMNEGWFEGHGLGKGATVSFLKKLPSAS